MDADALLEQELLSLGTEERELTSRIRQLREQLKKARDAGHDNLADDLADVMDATQRILAALVPRITEVEIKLYTKRRRKRP